MLSKSTVIKNNPELKLLINAVYNRIGKESIEDVNRHGISGGFSGFIYYSDTLAFYKRYRKMINKLAFELADELGEDVQSMVLNFRCVNNDNESKHDVAVCLFGGNLRSLKDDVHIPNALAWFAAEEICRRFED